MRMRSAKASHRAVISLGMAIAGIVIIFVALPSWLLFAIAGVGLIAGAYVMYQNGS